jgi:hypothetical protein
MAAIGALYEMEQLQSKDLFESAKKMIQLYLEERRKADVARLTTGKLVMTTDIDHLRTLSILQYGLSRQCYSTSSTDTTVVTRLQVISPALIALLL